MMKMYLWVESEEFHGCYEDEKVYAILGVSESTARKVKKLFKLKKAQLHPDQQEPDADVLRKGF